MAIPKASPDGAATLRRHTTETQIDLKLTIDGQGHYNIATGIRFLDHMLELFARHGGFDLELSVKAIWMLTSTTRWRISASPWEKHFRRHLATKKEFFVPAIF